MNPRIIGDLTPFINEPLDYQQQDVLAEVMTITSQQGVEAAINTAAGEQDTLTANTLAFEGEIVELVTTTNAKNYSGAFDKSLSFHQLSLGSAHRYGDKALADLLKAGNDFTSLLVQGEIQVPELQLISMEETGEALKAMRQQRTTGKIVMTL